MTRTPGRVLACAAIGLLVAATVLAQRPRAGRLPGGFRVNANVSYDGRFTFVRLNYATLPGGYWYGGQPAWSHGYPLAERNLMRILHEVSAVSNRVDEVQTLALDDPGLMKYPIAYIIEVGWWEMTDAEAAALRAYLRKGGFVVVDDFKIAGGIGGGGWERFEANMRRVLPDGRFVDLDPSHPIFHSFFEIDSFDIIPQAYNAGRPVFRGLFEDNDPAARMQMIVNYNTDISQFWEWSSTGFRPIDDTNQAYKLGVNYLMYALTH
ncbi:MAG: DUF4159 domain-containing protein [Gemmatimonadetes bacterium]|nr:DUF4159 domain-containing protein [Gemmatimonadota bacterium]